MSGTLAGKRALVTGGSAGIGLAIARRLRADGAEVTVTGREPQRLEHVATMLGCTAVRADATSDADVVAATERAAPFDIVVLNAGIRARAPVSATDVGDWDAIFAVNVRGAFLHARAAFPVLRERGGGAIITIGSDVAVVGDPTLGAYSVSKAALLALTKMLALDGAAANIRCNCVCPGDIKPGMFGRPDSWPTWPLPPLGRLGEAIDVAAAVAFLAGDDASWITGTALTVDGGMSAGYGTGYLRPAAPAAP